MLAVIQWRKGNWLDVHYRDVVDTYTNNLVVQTFRIVGADHHGSRFNCRGVDLYEVRDGLIACKDSFWKYIF